MKDIGMARDIDVKNGNSPQLVNQRIFHTFFAEHNNQVSYCIVLSVTKKDNGIYEIICFQLKISTVISWQ